MIKRNALIVALAMTILMIGASANANIISFDSLTDDTFYSFPYTEDGITLRNGSGSTFWIMDNGGILEPGGGNVVHMDGGWLEFDMGGLAFDLMEIQFRYVGFPESAVTVTGSDGSTWTSPTLDGILGNIDFTNILGFEDISWFKISEPLGA